MRLFRNLVIIAIMLAGLQDLKASEQDITTYEIPASITVLIEQIVNTIKEGE